MPVGNLCFCFCPIVCRLIPAVWIFYWERVSHFIGYMALCARTKKGNNLIVFGDVRQGLHISSWPQKLIPQHNGAGAGKSKIVEKPKCLALDKTFPSTTAVETSESFFPRKLNFPQQPQHLIIPIREIYFGSCGDAHCAYALWSVCRKFQCTLVFR